MVFEGDMKFQESLDKVGQMVDEFSLLEKDIGVGSLNLPLNSLWGPPVAGNFAINVNASVSNGSSAMAMVVRNAEGQLIFVVTKWGVERDPAIAELEALIWAARSAKEYGWDSVEWQSDAQTVVNQILS